MNRQAINHALRFVFALTIAGITYALSRVIGAAVQGDLYASEPGPRLVDKVFGVVVACLSFLFVTSFFKKPNSAMSPGRAFEVVTNWIAIAILLTSSLFLAVQSLSTVSSGSTVRWEGIPVVPRVHTHYDFMEQFLAGKAVGCVNCDLVHVDGFTISGDHKPVLFMHPHSEVSYRVRIPEASQLSFSLALAPAVWKIGKGDGVQFEICVDDSRSEERIYSQYIDPKNDLDQRRWRDDSVNLEDWGGQVITITFVTQPGPNQDDSHDWAGWGEPRIVQPIAYDFLANLAYADRGSAGEEQVRQDAITIDYEPRSVLFQHPTGQVTYRLEMPRGAELYFGLGLEPAVWSPDNGDGVEYNVYLRDPDEPNSLDRVYHRYLDPKNNIDDRHWVDEVVDLSAYGGQIVDIIFEARPGPVGDASFDWGGWSTPVLVADDISILNPAPPATGSLQDHQQ
ncbi:hypothetical protein ACFLYD_00180 [Chloroflexota bacterium]